ncbi:MAG: hypothetical protein AB1898_32755 [Acidobacteriota bacterium]
MPRLTLTLLSLFFSALLTIDDTAVDRGQGDERWAEHNYTNALEILLPNRAAVESRFAKDLKWVLSGRVLPPHEENELGFFLQRDYQGQAQLTIIRPRRDSIIMQLRALRKEFPDASLDRILGHVSLEHKRMAASDHPEVGLLADQFEEVRMSPVPPLDLFMDATGYEFWIETKWGSRTSILLSGPGSQALKQQHPLVLWAEGLRRFAARDSSK